MKVDLIQLIHLVIRSQLQFSADIVGLNCPFMPSARYSEATLLRKHSPPFMFAKVIVPTGGRLRVAKGLRFSGMMFGGGFSTGIASPSLLHR